MLSEKELTEINGTFDSLYTAVEKLYQLFQADNQEEDIIQLQKEILRLTQEEVSINAKDDTLSTVITTLVAKEGRPALRTAWWLIENICGASEDHIVEGLAKRGDVKTAYDWMGQVKPIWLARGLAFGGHQKGIERYMEQHNGAVGEQKIDTVGLLASSRLIASAILGGQTELYHILREKMVSLYRNGEASITEDAKDLGTIDGLDFLLAPDIETPYQSRMRKTASMPLIIISEALGLSGNEEAIEEFLVWVSNVYGPTVFMD